MLVTFYLTVEQIFITGYTTKEFLKSCETECCDADGFKGKRCPEPYVCNKFRCELPECPYECCDGMLYKEKRCSNQNYICDNYKHVCIHPYIKAATDIIDKEGRLTKKLSPKQVISRILSSSSR